MKPKLELCSFKQEMQNGSSNLSRPWKSISNIKSTTAFTFIWNLVSWSPVLLFGGGSVTVNGQAYQTFDAAFTANPMTATVFLFPIIGMMMMYHCVALWVNKTEIKLENGFLILNRGPMPWIPKEVKIAISDIKQAYVQEYSPYTENKNRVIRYQLMVQRHSSGDMVFENGISNVTDAQMLEQWLEKNLGIKDVAVPEEYDFRKKAA